MNGEWIAGSDGCNRRFKREALLNYGMNRWGLNKASSVGRVSELVRLCSPAAFEEWERFYFDHARQQKKEGIAITREFLTDLGARLHVKLSKVVQSELASISESECVDYVYNLVINRTYDGYVREIETVYGILQELIGIPINPAPDEWDRLYNVDFSIAVKEKHIGIQIKPISFDNMMEDYRWRQMQETTHAKFKAKYHGKVFIVYSAKQGKKKSIRNTDVIDAIRDEITRLQSMH